MNILEMLSGGLTKPTGEFTDPEEGRPRRHERRLRGDDGEYIYIVVGLRQEFTPTTETNDLRKEINKARLRVVRAYEKIVSGSAGNGSPNIRSLEKFRELVRKVAVLENEYLDLETVARQAHEAAREEERRQIGQHRESGVNGHRVPFPLEERLREGLAGTLADALAEGRVTPREFRLMKSRLSL